MGFPEGEEVVVLGAVRTPIGRATRGSFKDTTPDTLLSAALTAAPLAPAHDVVARLAGLQKGQTRPLGDLVDRRLAAEHEPRGVVAAQVQHEAATP